MTHSPAPRGPQGPPGPPERPGVSRRSVVAALAGLGGAVSLGACASPRERARAGESLRACFHMTPPRGWLCDCQRPVVLNGRTHLYYLHAQTNAGPGGWDVCTSEDLVAFGGNRVAIPMGDGVPVWTGSAVVDEDGTAGFGAGALVVLATRPTGGRARHQEQYLYWSHDGESFTARPEPVIANPDGDVAVTPEEIGNAEWFRDPKVVRDQDRSQWVCVIGRRKYLSVYVSGNLIDWSWASNFDYLVDGAADLGGMECPDLFRITADDGSAHWIIAASMDAYASGLPMTYAYWVGQWDGTRFTADDIAPQWLDRGWDWYAAVTWPSEEDPERVRHAIGWMNNWKYAARDTPTDASDGYNGQMSVVRRIRLVRRPDGRYSLLSEPVPALRDALGEPRALERREVSGRWEAPWSGRAYELELDIEWDAADDVGVSVGCAPDDARHTDIGVRDGRVYVDRGPSDRTDYSFRPYLRAEAPIDPGARRVHLRIEVDTQSVEVFVDDGGVVVSQQVYFQADDAAVRLYAHGGCAVFSHAAFRPART
ncbi:glycoside hydrolase family 32 protein [Actinomyces sp. oral taxon 414]|uniref:glycoside hydrolase family 32 protein n=1 Tax=Actinomyces sp. oral taxon 414 TaxID=712122 RepID=UPI0009F92FAD|nr:glycoside hydrolase family 32 protein [Actinomyces sp. oral taxon 414]